MKCFPTVKCTFLILKKNKMALQWQHIMIDVLYRTCEFIIWKVFNKACIFVSSSSSSSFFLLVVFLPSQLSSTFIYFFDVISIMSFFLSFLFVYYFRHQVIMFNYRSYFSKHLSYNFLLFFSKRQTNDAVVIVFWDLLFFFQCSD